MRYKTGKKKIEIPLSRQNQGLFFFLLWAYVLFQTADSFFYPFRSSQRGKMEIRIHNKNEIYLWHIRRCYLLGRLNPVILNRRSSFYYLFWSQNC